MSTLELFGGIVAVPLLLLGIFLLFAWRYRKAVAASMATRADAHAQAMGAASSAAMGQTPATLRVGRYESDREVPLGDAARAALAYARSQDRSVRLSFLAAGAAYWVLIVAAVLWVTRARPAPVLAIEVWLSALPVLTLVAAFASRSWRSRMMIALSYLLIGAGLIPVIGGLEPWRRAVTALAELNALLPAAGLLLLLVRRLRSLLVALAAMILYVVAGALLANVWLGGRDLAEVATGVRWSLRPMMAVGVLAHLAGWALFFWALGRRRVGRVFGALIGLAVLAYLLDRLLRPSFPLGPMALAIPGAAVQVGFVWAFFKLLIWLEARRVLPAQVLHFHLATGFLALYSMIVLGAHAQQIGASPAIRGTALLAFAVAAAVLHTALRSVWSRPRETRIPRLLLLRVFGSAEKRERLLDLLDDGWRRVGRVDLVGGTDLALRTLSSRMLEAFLLRRLDTGFLRTPDEVSRRLARLDERIQGDARYPVNELYCYADVWSSVVTRLAPASDVVLMDLRGFTGANRGCEFELTQLIWTVPLARVVLLTDERTDELALQQVANAAWAALPDYSPNASGLEPELHRIDLWDGSDDGARALVRTLFRIAFTAPGSRNL